MISQILFATIATFCFGFLINIRGKYLIFASIAGFVSASVYQVLSAAGLHPYSATFLATIAFALYAELMARKLKATVSTFALCGLLPLAPGESLYRAMDAFVKNDWVLGQTYATSAIVSALLLALGILVVGGSINLFLSAKVKRSIN